MEWQDYEQNIKNLLAWYKRNLNDKQHDILFSQVKHIPAVAFKDIVDSLINDSKYFPSIQEIKNRYQAWRSAHPEQTKGYERTLCLDCHGTGFLWVKKKDKGLNYQYGFVYRCGACKNWKGQLSNVPFLHRSLAEKDGIEITHPKYRAENEDRIRPMKTSPKNPALRKTVENIGGR